MNIVLPRLNATIVYQGLTEETGLTWSHMIDQTSKGKYDMSVTGFSQTKARHEVVDFSISLMATSLRIMYRRGPMKNKWYNYLYPFRGDTWLCVASFCVVSTISVFTINVIMCFDKTQTFKEKMAKHFTTAVAFSLCAVVGRRRPDEPTQYSSRIVFLSVSFFGFVLIR